MINTIIPPKNGATKNKETIINVFICMSWCGANSLVSNDIIDFTSNAYPLLMISPGSSLSSLTLTPVQWLRSAPHGPDVQPDHSQRPRVSSAAP